MHAVENQPVRFRFDGFELRPSLRQVLDGGKPLAIGARAFDLLLTLVEHRDRVLSVDELLALGWPGLVVEENNLRQQVAALRRALGPDVVVTLPGRGYRFGRAVEVATESAKPVEPVLDHAARPTVAVLRFSALSGDRGLALVSEALVEDLTALIARVGGVTVISRGSSQLFQGADQAPQDIGRELGARYLIDGALREDGDDMRLTVRLVEADGARVLWSGAYACSRADVLNLQGGIARSVLTEIEPELNRAELLRIERQRSDSVDAWGLYRQGLGQLGMHGLTPGSIHLALGPVNTTAVHRRSARS